MIDREVLDSLFRNKANSMILLSFGGVVGSWYAYQKGQLKSENKIGYAMKYKL